MNLEKKYQEHIAFLESCGIKEEMYDYEDSKYDKLEDNPFLEKVYMRTKGKKNNNKSNKKAKRRERKLEMRYYLDNL